MGWIRGQWSHICGVPTYDVPWAPDKAVQCGDLWRCETCSTIWTVVGRTRMMDEDVETWKLFLRPQRYPSDGSM